MTAGLPRKTGVPGDALGGAPRRDPDPPTLHARIKASVRDHILSGRWPPGHRLPFEMEMAAEWGVSRMTVNKALSELTREGYLERHRKRGTFVALPRVQSAVLDIQDIGAEIAGRGLVHSYQLLSRALRLPDEDERAELPESAAEGPMLLALTALHSASGAPYCLERRLISLSSAPAAATAPFESQPPGTWLLREVPWSSARHRIRAIAASAADARLLGLAAGEPCLEILRRTESGGALVTLARLTYPGSRHQLIADFAPDGTGQGTGLQPAP